MTPGARHVPAASASPPSGTGRSASRSVRQRRCGNSPGSSRDTTTSNRWDGMSAMTLSSPATRFPGRRRFTAQVPGTLRNISRARRGSKMAGYCSENENGNGNGEEPVSAGQKIEGFLRFLPFASKKSQIFWTNASYMTKRAKICLFSAHYRRNKQKNGCFLPGIRVRHLSLFQLSPFCHLSATSAAPSNQKNSLRTGLQIWTVGIPLPAVAPSLCAAAGHPATEMQMLRGCTPLFSVSHGDWKVNFRPRVKQKTDLLRGRHLHFRRDPVGNTFRVLSPIYIHQ